MINVVVGKSDAYVMSHYGCQFVATAYLVSGPGKAHVKDKAFLNTKDEITDWAYSVNADHLNFNDDVLIKDMIDDTVQVFKKLDDESGFAYDLPDFLEAAKLTPDDAWNKLMQVLKDNDCDLRSDSSVADDGL